MKWFPCMIASEVQDASELCHERCASIPVLMKIGSYLMNITSQHPYDFSLGTPVFNTAGSSIGLCDVDHFIGICELRWWCIWLACALIQWLVTSLMINTQTMTASIVVIVVRWNSLPSLCNCNGGPNDNANYAWHTTTWYNIHYI